MLPIDVSDPVWITITVSIVIPLLTFLFFSHDSREPSDIPWAPGRIPLLGHALSYRTDPSGFLLRACESVGSIFQLNLAGKHMVLVAGADAQRQIAKAPERLLSARQAVADIGFEETLGALNVHQGTDLHKGIVKGIWQRNAGEQMTGWRVALQQALATEVDGQPQEWFQLIRRVMLRATIDRMISPHFLQNASSDDFLDQFMNFQDQLEDVTAKAVVLPKWISLPFLLRPVRKQREKLQLEITQRLNKLLFETSLPTGFWLAQMHPRYSTKDIAEYIVGLLFAAHKNPAIGAAQAYLMCHEHCSEEEQQEVEKAAEALLASSGDENWNTDDTTLQRVCLETLRLTAHSIGAVRTVQEDFVINVTTGEDSKTRSYVLRKGTSVGLTHITPSLNPKLWGPEASEFHVNAHPLDSYRDEYKFTTFSHGVHKCPGQQLAIIIMQLTVALLFKEYDITLPSKIPPLSFERATLAQREEPVMVQIQKREGK